MKAEQLYNKSLDFLEGKGVRKDFKKAFDLNSQAAETGYHDAVLAMGWFYLNGIGVERNIDMAKEWYRKSARQGEPRAMFSLGQIVYEEYDSKSLLWFQRAFNAGHARSGYWLGKLYWHGQGVKKDKKKAMQLFTEAAKGKVKEAQRVLQWINRERGK